MLVHPAIAALRGEVAPQPRVDAALAEWRARPDVAAVREGLAAYGAGAPLAAAAPLARLLHDAGAARALAEGLIEPLAAALGAEPLAQLPFGTAARPGLARIRLAESGRAALNLAVFAPRAAVPPASVLFEDGEAHEIVLAGAGEGMRYGRSEAGLEAVPFALRPGTRILRAGLCHARQIIAVSRPLLVLQLTREAERPEPSCELALPGGAPIKAISACKRTSQQLMALGVLGALGHRPALGAMERIAQDAAAPRDLRWEALRQMLALDARRGMALLAELAARGGDALAVPAASLLGDLLAAQPDLAQMEPA